MIDRLQAHPRLLLAVVCVVFGVSATFVHPLGIAGVDEYRNADWLNCRSFDALTRRALLEDGEFPLRTHLLGGGFPVAAHPSDGSWAPTIVAVLLFGDVVGTKINLLLFLIAGAWGVHALARRFAGCSEAASLLAGALFAVSGWLPSMWLVGFYNQVFYLLAPAVLHLLLTHRPLWGGLLLALVLQQGGLAFPAVVFFLSVAAWGMAAAESAEADDGVAGAWGGPFAVLLLGTSAPAFARGLESPAAVVLGWGTAALLTAATPRMRRFARALLPWVGRLALLLVVCCSLGAARLAGIVLLEGEDTYTHELQRRDALWFPDLDEPPMPPEERFYDSPADFVIALSGRVPARTEYGEMHGRDTAPVEYEYAWLGLTPPFVGLLFVGLGLALRGDRRRQLVAGLGILFALISFGWRAPPDLHFLMTWGVPPLDRLAQPLKYWNFFVLLPGVLLVGVAVDRLPRREVAIPVVALLLVWPFVQNRATLAELFLVERPAGPPAERYLQVATVAEEAWVERGEQRIRALSDEAYLREYVRPTEATEYWNVRRGLGVVDHYGSLVLPEHAIPATYLTLDGVAVPNPRYRGEAWVDGPGTVESVVVGHNRIVVEATLEAPGTVVVNQNWLEGFTADVGEVGDRDGLLAVALPAGRHRATLRYRPGGLLAGFGISALSWIFWGVLALRPVVSRRRARATGAPSGDDAPATVPPPPTTST